MIDLAINNKFIRYIVKHFSNCYMKMVFILPRKVEKDALSTFLALHQIQSSEQGSSDFVETSIRPGLILLN